MKFDLVQQAQRAVAEQVQDDPVLSAHANGNKLVRFIQGGLQRNVAPLAVAATLSLMGMSGGAQAQEWSSWNQGAATVTQAQIQQQQAVEQMRQRVAQQAQQQQQQQQAQEAKSKQAMNGMLENVGAALARDFAFKSGKNWNQGTAAGDLAKFAAQAATGQLGTSAGETAAHGAWAGTAIGAVSGKSGAAGAAIGGLLGYGVGKIINRTPEQPPQQVQTIQVAENYDNSGQVVGRSAPASGGAAATRKLVIWDAASMGLPDVMVQAARERGMGIVAPGTRPLPSSMEQMRSDPSGQFVDKAVSAMALFTKNMMDRTTLMNQLDQARLSGNPNQVEIGQTAQQIARVDQVVRTNLGVAIEHINNASALGGYDTSKLISMAATAASQNYRPDANVVYRSNTSYAAPR